MTLEITWNLHFRWLILLQLFVGDFYSRVENKNDGQHKNIFKYRLILLNPKNKNLKINFDSWHTGQLSQSQFLCFKVLNTVSAIYPNLRRFYENVWHRESKFDQWLLSSDLLVDNWPVFAHSFTRKSARLYIARTVYILRYLLGV